MSVAAVASRAEVLKNRHFRWFFAGNAVSRLGDSPIPVAFAIATYQISGSAGAITAVLLSLWAARLVMVAPAGRYADGRNRAQVMILADVVRIAAQGGLAVVVISPLSLQVWHLCVASVLYGVGTALYNPAQIGLTPGLVAPAHLKQANGMLAVVADVSFLLGPALAGLLMSTVGFFWVLVLDCLSFAGNIVLLARVVPVSGRVRRAPDDEGGDTSAADDSSFRAGLRVAGGRPWFVAGLMLWFLVSLGIGLVAVAGPVLSLGSFGGIAAWAVLSTCLAVGSLLGSLSTIVALQRLRWARAAAIVTLCCALQYVVLAAYRTAPPLWLVAGAFLLAAFATASCGVTWDVEYQRRVPERFLSRLASVENFTNSAGVPLGMLLGGVLAGGYQVLFLVLAGAVLLAGVYAAFRGIDPTMEAPTDDRNHSS